MDSLSMVGHLIRRLNQISTHVFMRRTQDEGFDLTPVQFASLDAIRANPSIDQAGVAAAIGYDRATIGGVIDRLVQKGWVARRVSPRDRRARELELTVEGRALLDQVLPTVRDLQGDILTKLTPEERDVFLRLARKAIETD